MSLLNESLKQFKEGEEEEEEEGNQNEEEGETKQQGMRIKNCVIV